MLANTTIKRMNAISEVSKSGKKVNGLYRLMESKELFIQAYQNIYANHGATTKGTDDVTLDGFSVERINGIIENLKKGEYDFTPVRRTYIPKKNGKYRPLGIPSGNDKLVQEVVRMILNQIYEPIFSEKSHGFRQNKSCHTALIQVKQTWTGTKWIIEMDIKGFFDNMSHDVLMGILKKKIDDKRFLKLIEKILKAGYLEEWKFHETYSGTPQGGIVSPILANIYLNEMDSYVETLISEFNKGKSRKENPEYAKIRGKMERCRQKYDAIKDSAEKEQLEKIKDELEEIYKKRQEVKWGDPFDKTYRRLTYCRYADDFIMGVIGSKEEACEIANKVKEYVESELKMEIAEEKYHINHASRGVRFLGYEVKSYTGKKTLRVRLNGKSVPQRTVSERIQLIIPKEKLQTFAINHGYGDYHNHIPKCRDEITCGSEAEIISTYNAELRGLCNYYALGYAANKRLNQIVGLARTSCAMTIAKKHKTTTTKIIAQLRKDNGEWVLNVNGEKKDYQFRLYRLVTDFKPKAFCYENIDTVPKTGKFCFSRNELVRKLEANVCEYCGSTENVEVHHIRAMKDIKDKTDLWAVMMKARNRKTMVLCKKCHSALHSGKLS